MLHTPLLTTYTPKKRAQAAMLLPHTWDTPQ